MKGFLCSTTIISCLTLVLSCEEGERSPIRGTQCKAYSECRQGTLFALFCEVGSIFDNETLSCKKNKKCNDDNSKCSQDITYLHPKHSRAHYLCNNVGLSLSFCPVGKTYNQHYNSCEPNSNLLQLEKTSFIQQKERTFFKVLQKRDISSKDKSLSFGIKTHPSTTLGYLSSSSVTLSTTSAGTQKPPNPPPGSISTSSTPPTTTSSTVSLPITTMTSNSPKPPSTSSIPSGTAPSIPYQQSNTTKGRILPSSGLSSLSSISSVPSITKPSNFSQTLPTSSTPSTKIPSDSHQLPTTITSAGSLSTSSSVRFSSSPVSSTMNTSDPSSTSTVLRPGPKPLPQRYSSAANALFSEHWLISILVMARLLCD